MNFRVIYTGLGMASIADEYGEVYMCNLTDERASEIVKAWNNQEYEGIDD